MQFKDDKQDPPIPPQMPNAPPEVLVLPDIEQPPINEVLQSFAESQVALIKVLFSVQTAEIQAPVWH